MSRTIIQTWLVCLCVHTIGWTLSLHIKAPRLIQFGDNIPIEFSWDDTTNTIEVFKVDPLGKWIKIAGCAKRLHNETTCVLKADEQSKDYGVLGKQNSALLVIYHMRPDTAGTYICQDAHNTTIRSSILIQPNVDNTLVTKQPNVDITLVTNDNVIPGISLGTQILTLLILLYLAFHKQVKRCVGKKCLTRRSDNFPTPVAFDDDGNPRTDRDSDGKASVPLLQEDGIATEEQAGIISLQSRNDNQPEGIVIEQ